MAIRPSMDTDPFRSGPRFDLRTDGDTDSRPSMDTDPIRLGPRNDAHAGMDFGTTDPDPMRSGLRFELRPDTDVDSPPARSMREQGGRHSEDHVYAHDDEFLSIINDTLGTWQPESDTHL